MRSALGRCGLVLALVGCGGRQAPLPWIEEELGGEHATAAAAVPAGAAAPSVGAPGMGQGGAPAVEAALAALRRAATPAARDEAHHALTRALAAVSAAQAPAVERLATSDVAAPGQLELALWAARWWLHARAHDRAAPHLARAKTLLASAAALEQDTALASARTELAGLEGALRVAPVSAGLVAVLLPMSGRFAAVGRELSRTLTLAPPGVTFRVLDTRGDEREAAAMVDRAVEAGAVAILGPVGDREARAAARRAAERGVPIALLAPGDGASRELGVLRLAYSVEDEARAVADWAAANDHRAVAVMAPRDDVGELAAAAFATRAAALGLAVVARGLYDAAGGEVERDVKALLGLVPASNPRLARHLRRGGKRAWQTFVPEVAFSLLYLPDRGERGALIAAYLPYLGVELRTQEIMDPLRLRRKYQGQIPQVVQLIAGAGWSDPSLPARGGPALQGAMVLDVCTGQRDDVADDARARLTDALGHPPSAAAAQMLDAATWLTAALAGPAASDRAAARAALLRTQLELGACGPLAIDEHGEATRQPVLLQIEGEDLVLAP